eukprot:UN29545
MVENRLLKKPSNDITVMVNQQDIVILQKDKIKDTEIYIQVVVEFAKKQKGEIDCSLPSRFLKFPKDIQTTSELHKHIRKYLKCFSKEPDYTLFELVNEKERKLIPKDSESFAWNGSDNILLICCGKLTGYVSMKRSLFAVEKTVSKAKSLHLNQLFKNYLAKERLDKENKILCEKCKKKTSQTKQLSLTNLPEYLLITLNRFKQVGIRRIKDEQHVDFKENLTFNGEYELYAVISHEGSCEAGHYISHIKIEKK